MQVFESLEHAAPYREYMVQVCEQRSAYKLAHQCFDSAVRLGTDRPPSAACSSPQKLSLYRGARWTLPAALQNLFKEICKSPAHSSKVTPLDC